MLSSSRVAEGALERLAGEVGHPSSSAIATSSTFARRFKTALSTVRSSLLDGGLTRG